MNVPVNRHQRRAALATGKYTGPTPKIRVLLIDGPARMIKPTIMEMSPENFLKILGDRTVKWAKLGEIDKRVHIMLAGDPTPQQWAPGHRWYEQDFVVADEKGVPGPVLRGKAVIFGFAPALKKAASTPVNPVWLEERLTWLEPGPANELRLEYAAQMESEPRQIGAAEEPGAPGVPALSGDRSLDG